MLVTWNTSYRVDEMKRLDLLTLVILNRLRNELALREMANEVEAAQENPEDQDGRDDAAEGKDECRELPVRIELVGIKKPGGAGWGFDTAGSALTAAKNTVS